VAVGVAFVVAVFGCVAQLLGTQFFYVGDNPESFVPLWHHFGTEIRAGNWHPVESSGWMGGNYLGEAAYAQWNPLLLAAYVVVSLFADLSLAAAAVMIAMLSMLGSGAYLLMRSYGAGKLPSVIAASALPVTGFTLFYEAAGWPAGLAAFVGVTFFWLAVRKQVLGVWPPIATFVAGYLAVTTGNPYALLGILVVLAGAFVELLGQRRWRDATSLVASGALVGAVALLVFLPLLGAQPVTVRQELAGIYNDTFMVPGLGDVLASSTPSFLPAVTNWGGAQIESLPSTYLAWFALPLIPWLRWRRLWNALRPQRSIVAVGLIFAITVFGPSNLWLFRWPIRLIEYLYLVALLIFAIALSQGLARTAVRARMLGSAAIVLVGGYLAVAVTPGGIKIHAAGTALSLVLLAAFAFAVRSRGLAAGFGVLLVGTALVVGLQAAAYPRGEPTILPPADLSTMKAQSASFEGTVLQLAEQRHAGPDAVNDGKILFGNLPAALGYESVNRYSGISFRDFSVALCMDYKGATCPEALDRLLRPVEHTQGDLLAAMRVDTLVLQRAAWAAAIDEGPPSGWRVAGQDSVRTIWVRETPSAGEGRLSGTSPGTEATSVASSEMAETVNVDSDGGGTITFARLAWPGYSATADGVDIPVSASAEGLLQVEVRPGESTVRLTYEPPGLKTGWIAVGIAALLALFQSFWWGVRRVGTRRTVTSNSEDHVMPHE
jgi:hypothetical protein